MRKEKGSGKYQSNSLTLSQSIKLIDWCRQHKDDKRTYPELSIQASNDVGFTVTASNMATHWVEANGPRHEANGGRITGGVLAGRIKTLEARIAECERRLTEAGA